MSVWEEDGFHHEGTKETKGSDDQNSELRAPFDFAQDTLRVLRDEKGSSGNLLAGGDEGFEDSPVTLASRRQNFGMPLHADDKRMARAFDTFDHTVIGDGVDDQAFAESFDRLVMSCIDLQAWLLNDGAQACSIGNLYSVSALSFLFTLLMFAGVGHLRGDVLVKRTP